MGRESKKPIEAPKNMNIMLDGPLHQKIKKMAKAHNRSVQKEIVQCLQECLERWEDSASRGAAMGDHEDSVPPRQRKVPGDSP